MLQKSNAQVGQKCNVLILPSNLNLTEIPFWDNFFIVIIFVGKLLKQMYS